jgi:ATP-dependent Clp protease adaptor protein ClpS
MAPRYQEEGGVATEQKQKPKLQKPQLYKVLLHNDDYTTREFVVAVLEEVFNRPYNDAVQIMLHIHNNGLGVAGVYSYEVAETKVNKVHRLAKQAEFPLRCSMEPE